MWMSFLCGSNMLPVLCGCNVNLKDIIVQISSPMVCDVFPMWQNVWIFKKRNLSPLGTTFFWLVSLTRMVSHCEGQCSELTFMKTLWTLHYLHHSHHIPLEPIFWAECLRCRRCIHFFLHSQPIGDAFRVRPLIAPPEFLDTAATK